MVLYGILAVYFGLALLGFLIPLVDLENTTKRGLFKLLPLMLLYLCNSSSIAFISGKLARWVQLQLSTKTVPDNEIKGKPPVSNKRK